MNKKGMFRLIFAFGVIAAMASIPVAACVSWGKYELEANDLKNIIAFLNKNNFPVNSSTPIQFIKAYGLGSPYWAYISFAPYKTVNGAEIFYKVHCKKKQGGWVCDEPEEKRGIRFSEPDDALEIDNTMDAMLATNIIRFVRDSIFVNKKGDYIAYTWEGPETFLGPLDILSISQEGEEYIVKVNNEGICARHLIKVRRIQCGLPECDFEIISNKVEHYASNKNDKKMG